jgi:hypothetical protein
MHACVESIKTQIEILKAGLGCTPLRCMYRRIAYRHASPVDINRSQACMLCIGLHIIAMHLTGMYLTGMHL